MRRRSDDLPAFGKPTSAASASSLRRRSSLSSSPGRPVSAKRGVCRVGVAKRLLPRPGAPPRATTTRAPGCARSASSCPSSSKTCVPTGTPSSACSPDAPCFRAPRPLPPRPALMRWFGRNAERSRRSGSASSTTFPPGPPSPPSGPPFGTCFSRRNERPPSPPRPACTWMRARSWNTALLRDGNGALVAARPKNNPAVARGEDRVVAADSGARAGAEARTALPDEDHPRLDLLPVEQLHAEPLGLGVATVLGGTETFLVCHLSLFLCDERGLDRGERALPLRMLLLVRVRGFEHRAIPALGARRDLRDSQLGVVLRETLRSRGHLGRLRGGLALCLRGGLALCLRGGLALCLRGRLARADSCDFDPRQRRSEARVPLVARLGLVLADTDLRPAREVTGIGARKAPAK